ncbi:polyprenyl synthetase family protein [Litorimonas sp. RW-G-Af-16]|uniref:polyprenyl synthetase family protein n=1 Tax=Litorimonas sp. RW-G-Af-16 TaxID=3241168 RepID=UPI00390C9C36
MTTDAKPLPIRDAQLPAQIKAVHGMIETRLASIVPTAQTWPARLHEAQRHALLSPGKRFRPLLCVFVAKGGGVETANGLDAAVDVGCVAEMVHAASLILDDLPCMDDADLRRNQPTTHIAFDESTAILTATALLNCAFGVLASLNISAQQRVEMIDLLSYAVGSKGLIAGQMADLANTDQNASIAEIERLNTLKTGALFDFSVEAAAILAELSAARRAALKDFSYHLGLAFQLMDDVKDTVMNEDQAEKSVGRDIGKATILALAGSDAAKQRLHGYIDSAKDALSRAELCNTPTMNAVLDKQFAFLDS